MYYDKNYLRTNICSINQDFLLDIQKELLNNNIYSVINCEVREGKEYRVPQGVSTNCKNMYRLFVRRREDINKFYNYMYDNSTIHLTRKKLKFEGQTNTELISRGKVLETT